MRVEMRDCLMFYPYLAQVVKRVHGLRAEGWAHGLGPEGATAVSACPHLKHFFLKLRAVNVPEIPVHKRQKVIRLQNLCNTSPT